MEHVIALKILIGFLAFEMIVGAWLGFVYSNLWRDWKAIQEEKRRVLRIGKDWLRFKKYVKECKIDFTFNI